MSELNIKRSLLLAEALQWRHAARVADERDDETFYRLAVIDVGGALCGLYVHKGCDGCPVNADGHYCCADTPMELAVNQIDLPDPEICYKAAEYLEKLAGEMG